MRIGLLEDDAAQAEMLTLWLTEADHDVHHKASGEDFLSLIKNDTFDLLLIDWNVPDMEGTDVLEVVREGSDWKIPVIFVTSRDRDEDIVYALQHGADDYMTKPAKRAEVLARIDAVARRALPDQRQHVQELPPFTLDTGNGVILKHGEPIKLTKKEYDLAIFLFKNRGRLLSRGYILQNVWGRRPDLNTRTVDTHISFIRNKLGLRPADGWRLSSVYQHGYRLEQLNEA